MREDIYTKQGDQKVIDLQKLFGRGYNNGLFFNFKGRYRFYVGSRSSKKSQNMLGYEIILKLLSDDRRNIIVCRQNDIDNRTSTFPNIVSCIEDLGLTDKFKTTTQPLEITYKPTGQKIVFKGMNNPTSITSTKFAHGYLTDIYLEELYEIQNYSDFLQLDGSMRVDKKTAKEIGIQITGVMNPWSPDHWVFTEFFKGRLEPTEEYMETHMWDDYCDPNFIGPFGKGLYLHQSNYKINEFRDESWDLAAQEMKKRSPELYKPNFLGLFGATTGLCYPEFKENCLISANDILARNDIIAFAIGIDTGLSNGEGKKVNIKKGEDASLRIRSATTMALIGITKGYDKIIVCDEYFHSNNRGDNNTNTDNQDDLSHPELLNQLIVYITDWIKKYSSVPKGNLLMKGVINCYVDNADIATRQGLQMKAREYGLYNINFIPSTKRAIQTRVDFTRLLMAYSCYLVNKDWCPNLIRELKTARKGEKGEARAPGNDHLLDACDYANSPFYNSITMWKTKFKEH